MNPTEKTDPEYNWPTFYGTIVESKPWQAWVKVNEQNPQFDAHESMEIGALSPEHFAAFLDWHKNNYEN
jgi:hypothetical protein